MVCIQPIVFRGLFFSALKHSMPVYPSFSLPSAELGGLGLVMCTSARRPPSGSVVTLSMLLHAVLGFPSICKLQAYVAVS